MKNLHTILLILITFVIIGCTSDEADNSEITENNENNEEVVIVPNYATVIDAVGNIYPTLKVGNQEWMAENLASSSYCEGYQIIKLAYSEDEDWPHTYSDSYPTMSPYYNSDFTEIKGWVYNLKTVRMEIEGYSICPCNWHIPTLEEFNILFDNLGGKDVAGFKMLSENYNSTNESGFSAEINDFFDHYGTRMNYNTQNASWWTSTEYEHGGNNIISLNRNDGNIKELAYLGGAGFPIRCIKD